MKIYVAIPDNGTKGGVESLYQFASGCRDIGYQSYVYYFRQTSKVYQIPESMSRKYNLHKAEKVEDSAENVIIFPEMYTYPLRKFHYIKKCIWFLSLNYYLESDPVYKAKESLRKRKLPKVLLPAAVIAMAAMTTSSFRRIRIHKEKIPYYLYNCEYAHNFINSVCNYPCFTHYLCGPIDDIYFESLNIKKEKIVSYNPKKCTEYTNKVIELVSDARPDIMFIPIQAMTIEKVREVLMRSSVYMDLGKFPGPERIPREAVMMNCNIITSMLGSAGNNDIDVPIKSEYKFELTDINLEKIQNLIIDMIDNYELYVSFFDKYRQKVIEQKRRLHADIQEFLSACSS